MEPLDDEDVLLENSPLYDYLKEACPDEHFLTCETTSSHEQLQDSEVTSTSDKDKGGELESGWFTKLRDYRHQDTQIVVDAYLHEYMSVILSSQSIFTEDIQILLMYSNEKIPEDSTKSKLAYQHGQPRNGQTLTHVLSTFGLFATLVGLCIGGYRATSSESHITPFQILTWSMLLALCLLNSILYGSAWWVNSLLHRQHKDNVKLLDSMVKLHDNYGSLLRKCIRYVQEIEVISRGFTLATPFTPAAQLDGLDTLLAEQQCPLLREVCFQTCKHQIFALKEATMSLLRHTRLQPEVDGTTSYLAKMDLDKIIPSPPPTSQDAESEDVDVSPTTKSLAVLKVMYDLYIELKSEFLRRLMLCLCPDAVQCNEKLDADSLHIWHTILAGLAGTSQKTLSKLDHSYEWHKERPTSRRRGDGQDDQYRPLQVKWSPAKHLVTAVHSLRLHLDFALNGAITAEEHIASLSEDVIINQDHMEKTYKILETLLEGANEKLQSSHSCLQQASVALAKLQGKKAKKQMTEVKPEKQLEADPDAELPMTTLVMPVAPEDMDFEDVVYEADMAYEVHNTVDQDLDSDWLMEEKARRRQEAEETKHLLQELHTVLGQRSKEREQRKLMRQGVGVETQSDTDETGATNDGINERTNESQEIISNKQVQLEAEITSKNSDNMDENRTGEGDSRISGDGDRKSILEESGESMPGLSYQPFGLPPPRMGMPFMTSVAVEAVMRSKLRGALAEETFGQAEDSSGSEEEEHTCS